METREMCKNQFFEKKGIVNKIKNREPFAIMVYHEWLKSDKDLCHKRYEVIEIFKNAFVTYKITEKEIIFFRNNKHLFIQKIANENGGVYEFMNFSNTDMFKQIISLKNVKKGRID